MQEKVASISRRPNRAEQLGAYVVLYVPSRADDPDRHFGLGPHSFAYRPRHRSLVKTIERSSYRQNLGATFLCLNIVLEQRAHTTRPRMPTFSVIGAMCSGPRSSSSSTATMIFVVR
jgi:hypothetical protein